MATPAVGTPVVCQETQVLKELARSQLGGEVSTRFVGSLCVPPCALSLFKLYIILYYGLAGATVRLLV